MATDSGGIIGRRVVMPVAGAEDDYQTGGFLATVIAVVDEGMAIVQDLGGSVFAVREERVTLFDPSEDS